MSDLINKFVSDDAKQPLIEINGLFQDLVKSLKEVHAENKGIDVKINGAGSIKDLTSLMKQIADMQKQMGAMGTSIDQYNKLLKDTNTITQKLALAETEEAKAMMQAKVALEEKNRELKKSAQLENELYLARQKKGTNNTSSPVSVGEYEKLVQLEKEALAVARELAATPTTDPAALKAATDAAIAYSNQLKEIKNITTNGVSVAAPIVDRSAEIAQLRSVVEANNTLAQSERQLAEANQLAAAQSTDAVQKSALEAAAKQNLINAANAEQASKQALALASKDVSNEVRNLLAVEHQAASEQAKLAQATLTQSTAFQQEAKALYDTVKAHNEAAAAYRQEAAEKQKAALQSADAAQKTQLEAEASIALANAQREEKEKKEALASANKQVAQTVKDNILAENALLEAKKQLEAKMAQEIANAAKTENAYEKLKKEYNEAAYATKTLAAEYVLLQRAGTASTAELEKLRKELKLQQEATLQQSNALLEMEQAVGQNQRAVGAYANATGEITQILRELPNFAISAQTGILSLSNNLPMLQASLSRLAQTIDANTGAAIGWRGVLRTLGATLFSTQGAIVLLTTLAVTYKDDLAELVNTTTAAQKSNEAYKKSLEGTIQTSAEEIGQLHILQAALGDTTLSREQQNAVLAKTKEMFPGYFDSLRIENLELQSTNALINEQIELRLRQAQAKAAIDTVSEATSAAALAQQKLNEKIGFWERYWAAIQSADVPIYAVLGFYKKASAETQVLADRQEKLKKAQDELAESVKRANNPLYEQTELAKEKIKVSNEQIQKLQAEIKEVKDMDKSYSLNSKGAVKWIAQREKQIETIQGTIVVLNNELDMLKQLAEFNLRRETINKRVLSDEELAVVKAENNVRRYKKGSTDRLSAEKQAIDARLAAQRTALKQEYGTNEEALKLNEEYLTRESELYTKSLEEKRQADESYAKKNKTKKESKPFDPTKEILAQNQRVFAANQEFDKSQLEATNAHLENIFSIESNSLKKRLDAYEQYVANLAAISEIDYKTAITEKQKQLDAILAIEKKYGTQITEENQAEFSKRKALSGDERSLILQKFALMQELSVASAKQAETVLQINEKAQKREREIVESSIKYQVNVDKENYARLRDQTSKEVALRIDALNKRRSDGTVGEKAFWKERQYILSSESEILFEKEMEFLKERKDKVIAQLMDTSISDADRKSLQALQENIDVMFGNLERQRPEPRRVEKKSILSYLGFPAYEGNEAALIDESIREFQRQQDEQNAIIQLAKDNREAAINDAAIRYKIGSAEYAKAILDAAKAEVDAISAAESIKNASAKAQEAAEKSRNDIRLSVIEKQKEEIAKAIGDLMSTLRAAQNAALEAELSVIKSQMDAIDQRSEKERKAVEESILGEKEKAEKIKEIENAAFVDKENLSKREKKLRREQALNDRSVAIFQATISGSLAIQRAIAAGSVGSPVLAGIYAALIGAMTAAQIAAISSAPLPEYWKGTPEEGHKGGLAVVGERGTELGILPSGQQFLTPNSATIMDLPKGTEIIPNHDLASYTADMSNQEMKSLRDTSIGGAFLTQAQMEAAFAKSAEKIIKAIANKQEVHFGWSNGELVKSIKNGNQVTKWVGGLI